MSFRLTRLEAATAILATAQIALAVFVARMDSPDLVPMHFDYAGQVDRWGDHREAGMVIGFMAMLTIAAGSCLAWSARAAEAGLRRGLGWAQVILLATTAILAGKIALMASARLDPALVGPKISIMGLCVLFAVIGAFLGKVAPNRFVGVRTPWSRASRLAWEKSNRLAGRLLFWSGLAGLFLAPLAPEPLAYRVLIGAVLLAAALSVFESWRVWRADPERRIV